MNYFSFHYIGMPFKGILQNSETTMYQEQSRTVLLV